LLIAISTAHQLLQGVVARAELIVREIEERRDRLVLVVHVRGVWWTGRAIRSRPRAAGHTGTSWIDDAGVILD
jgi:hypothetical protein